MWWSVRSASRPRKVNIFPGRSSALVLQEGAEILHSVQDAHDPDRVLGLEVVDSHRLEAGNGPGAKALKARVLQLLRSSGTGHLHDPLGGGFDGLHEPVGRRQGTLIDQVDEPFQDVRAGGRSD